MAKKGVWRQLDSRHWRAKATHWQRRSWILYVALLLVFVLNTTMHAPATMSIGISLITGLILWLLQVFPLLVFIPAMRRELPRALSWMSLLVLVYLPFSIVASTRPVYWSGILLTLCLLAFMISLAYWVQCLKRFAAQRADEQHQGAA